MLIESLLSVAREKLVTIADDAPLIQAATLLRRGTDLVVVCGSAGLLAGVITKTDVVRQISQCHGAICITPTSLVMTRDVVFCRPGDWLNEVWSKLNERIVATRLCDGRRIPLIAHTLSPAQDERLNTSSTFLER